MAARRLAAPGPVFVASPREWRAWLEKHGSTATELAVGFHKRSSGRPSMTWPESVDEALCFGWIDGIRRRIDDERYQIRFTPRRPGSIWSAVNIGRVAVLSPAGRMQPAGLAAFARRLEGKSRTYAYEQPSRAALSPELEKIFRRHRGAWSFLEQQSASYRQRMLWWVMSAKQQITRAKRLGVLIEACERKQRL